jgi:GNAT superfamily N-acetyltransferase
MHTEILTVPAIHVHWDATKELLITCFPQYKQDYDTLITPDSFFESASGFHDKTACTWILLWNTSGELIGLITSTTYHDSLFIFNLCTRPSYRKKGVAWYLLKTMQAEASKRGIMALSGSVETRNKFLIDFYTKLGATREDVGISSDSNYVPKSVRFVNHFKDHELIDAAKELTKLRIRCETSPIIPLLVYSGTFCTMLLIHRQYID